jgi:hypothetical protein
MPCTGAEKATMSKRAEGASEASRSTAMRQRAEARWNSTLLVTRGDTNVCGPFEVEARGGPGPHS